MLTRLTVGTMLRWMTPENRGRTHSSTFLYVCVRFRLTDAFSMKYSPSESGHFDGQRGYGYVSIEKFIDAARSVNAKRSKPADYDGTGLPTIANTVLTTAILNAGRISLDEKRAVGITQQGASWILQ